MKTALILATSLLAGCSLLRTEPNYVDPRVSLGPQDRITVNRRELDDYRCLVGVLYCETVTGWEHECSCR